MNDLSTPAQEQQKEFPPGPNLGEEQLRQIFSVNPFPLLKTWFEEFGDKFTLELGDFGISDFNSNKKWVFISDAEDIRTVYKANAAILSAGKANQIQFARLLPSDGSVMLDGEEHIKRRKILGKILQNQRKIRAFTQIINQVIDKEVSQFPDGGVVSLVLPFYRFTAEIMRHLNFGPDNNEKATEISKQLAAFNEPNSTSNPVQTVAECTHIVGSIIDDYKRCPHSSGIEENSILATLMSESQQGNITEQQVQSELIVSLFAGTDTTAITMNWIMEWILAMPDVYQKVQKEIDDICGNDVPEPENLDKLTYLDAVIWEACRMSQELFTTAARLVEQPIQLGQYQIPAHTIIVVCTHLTHVNPANYDNAMAFNPDRFLGTNPDPYKMAHFGGGIRRCIGMNFALYEMKAAIARLLQTTRLEGVNISTEPEMRGAFYSPRGGVQVKVIKK